MIGASPIPMYQNLRSYSQLLIVSTDNELAPSLGEY